MRVGVLVVTPVLVRGRKPIKAIIEPVIGFYPSDDQLKRWARRREDPLPTPYVLGKPQGDERAIREWAARQVGRTE
jgi:hypothetical protein